MIDFSITEVKGFSKSILFKAAVLFKPSNYLAKFKNLLNFLEKTRLTDLHKTYTVL